MLKLSPGDKVGIVSPSRQVTPQEISYGLGYLNKIGLNPVLSPNVFASYRYMAGTPQQRASDLMEFYCNPEIKAIFSTAGGDGSQMIAPFLDYEIIRNNPKPLIGFSDTTAIQNAIFTQTGIPQITGFLLGYDFLHGNNEFRNGEISPVTAASLQSQLFGTFFKAQGGQSVIGGKAEGILVGGCISLFKSLCGTPYFPDIRGKILLIEDEEEKTYKLDLMLQQIRQQPSFTEIKGIVFGDFYNCEIRRPEDGSTDEMINYFCRGLSIPVIRRFPYGHQKSRQVLSIGSLTKIDADNCTLEQI